MRLYLFVQINAKIIDILFIGFPIFLHIFIEFIFLHIELFLQFCFCILIGHLILLTSSPSPLFYKNYVIFYAKPSRKTLNKFGKPSRSLIIPFLFPIVVYFQNFTINSSARSSLSSNLSCNEPFVFS